MADAQIEESVPSDVNATKFANHASQSVRSKSVGNGSADLNNSFENIDFNVDGDIEDADQSDEEAGSSDVSSRPKRKVKRKRKSKSLQHSAEEHESSTDSEYSVSPTFHGKQVQVDPKTLGWTMWLWYYIVAVSVGAFHVAEYMGEKLADFFGITTPKYQYVIDEYYRMKREEKEEKEREEREQEHVRKREAEKVALVEGGHPKNEDISSEVADVKHV